jgi:triphosphatase
MPAEIEARFAAATDAALDRLATRDRLGPASLGPMRSADEVDRYLDTPDGRLAAAGWACRLRTRGAGWRISLKGPPIGASADTPAWLHERDELEGPATSDPDPTLWPPSGARDRLAQLAAGAQLAEGVRLLQRRRERSVIVDGAVGGTLSLDAVRVVHGGRELGQLRVVELELPVAVDRTALDPLAAALSDIDGLTPDPRSKLERARAIVAEHAR